MTIRWRYLVVSFLVSFAGPVTINAAMDIQMDAQTWVLLTVYYSIGLAAGVITMFAYRRP